MYSSTCSASHPRNCSRNLKASTIPRSCKGSGDVKYHKGFSADMKTPGGNVHIALAFNPSHLEIVNPVVEGSVRARQQRRGEPNDRKYCQF